MQKQLIILLSASILLFTGCGSKIIYETAVVDQRAYQSRFKPIIGSRNNTARTIIDFGVVATIWVAPYKDQYGTLIAGHDIYVWLERPDFIPGSSVPTVNGSNRGIPTQLGKLPFSISPEEIDRADLSDDENIGKFINESYKNTDGSVMAKILKENEEEESKNNKKK